MIFEGVYFNEVAVSKMTKEEFETAHLEAFWKHLDEDKRLKMLDKVYSLIVKPAKKGK